MPVSAEDRLWETAKKLREARALGGRKQGFAESQAAAKERVRLAEEERKRKGSFLPALQGLVSGAMAGGIAGGPMGAVAGGLGGGVLGAVGRSAFNSSPGSMALLGQGAMSLAGVANARANDSLASKVQQRNMSLQTQLNPDFANPTGGNDLAPGTMDFGGVAEYEAPGMAPSGHENLLDAASQYDEMYGDLYETPASRRRGR